MSPISPEKQDIVRDNQLVMPRILSFRYSFFALIFVYIYVVGSFALPSVHYFFDAVAIRDTGTVWESLTWNVSDKRHFLPAAVMCHIEGPLQFLLLNFYYYLIGDLFPLNPTTTQFPNTIITFLCIIFAYLIGKKLYSDRFGYLCAVMFALMPWLAITIRLPWVFNTLSCCFELSTIYFYIGFVQEPEKGFYRAAAPISLAMYFTTGLDWPAFLFILFIYLGLSKKLRQAVRNVYNIIPLTVVFSFACVSLWLYYYVKYYSPGQSYLYKQTMLLYPFIKVGVGGTFPSLSKIIIYLVKTFGLTFPLAISGVVSYFYLRRKQIFSSDDIGVIQKRDFVAIMSLWLFVFSIPLLKNVGSVTYGYVLAVPVAILSSLFLVRVKSHFVVLLVFVLIGFQWYSTTQARTFAFRDDDRRVLAAAAFLIEKRSDLLEKGKRAFLPRNEPSNVGQYARGRNGFIAMPMNFPTEKFLHSAGTKEEILMDFITAYNDSGEIRADWLILSSETVTPSAHNQSSEFYRRLFADPQITWIACFKDNKNRKLWLGEVKEGGFPADMVKVYDVDFLADIYAEKYDKISFLKRNVRLIFHH